jgi:uncharacterized protein with FMN-binding domain
VHTFAVKALNVVLVISLVSAYHAVVSDRKADEAAAKKQLAEQQAGETETESPYADGVYTGEAKGFGGPVKMEVTIADGQITDCTVVSAEKEDAAYFEAAQGVIDEILEMQSTDVDVVSGATFSSNGILGAVEDALGKAAHE